MKVVWTFILITFSISALLSLGGVIDNELSAIGLFKDIIANGVSASSLWILLAGWALIVLGTVGANALTGGSSGVGITTGYYFFVIWAVVLVADFVSLINKVGTNCVLATGGLCSIGYYVVWIYGGLLAVGFIFALFDLLGGND